MAGLREMKKRLGSIRATGQLAGAMKTVSAAKYSRINDVLNAYREYSEVCAEIRKRHGSALSAEFPCANPDAPDCFVVLGSNRGLCGSYNNELLAYAEEVFEKAERPYLVAACGKHAIRYFEENGRELFQSMAFTDVPVLNEYTELFDFLCGEYTEGRIGSVTFIYQDFINVLTQRPCSKQMLPMEYDGADAETDGEKPLLLYVPDRQTVLHKAAQACLRADMYSAVLKSTVGAQAATLVAMRSAYDNANTSASKLELEISRRRQNEITARVIETSVENVQ